MRLISFILLICLITPRLIADGNFTLAIENDREYLGEWKIDGISIDGTILKASGYLKIYPNRYQGFVGCNIFYGALRVMEQNLLTIIPQGGTNHICKDKQNSIEAHFLRYFLGAFEVQKTLFDSKAMKYKIILKTPRMSIWLSPQRKKR